MWTRVYTREMERRSWVPDIEVIADQLIEDYRSAAWEVEGIGPTGKVNAGDLDALGTVESWQATARDHDEEFTEDDWVALVQELARRAAKA